MSVGSMFSSLAGSLTMWRRGSTYEGGDGADDDGDDDGLMDGEPDDASATTAGARTTTDTSSAPASTRSITGTGMLRVPEWRPAGVMPLKAIKAFGRAGKPDKPLRFYVRNQKRSLYLQADSEAVMRQWLRVFETFALLQPKLD